MRVAIYARVSTADKDQDPETQLHALRSWCAANETEVVHEYVDKASAKDMLRRRQWRQLLEDVRKGGFDIVLVTEISRAWRSMAQMYKDVEYLDAHGKALVMTRQPIDTRGAGGRFQRNMLMAMAEYERDLASERTKEGLQRAVANGARLGRPKGAKDKSKRKRGGYVRRWER